MGFDLKIEHMPVTLERLEQLTEARLTVVPEESQTIAWQMAERGAQRFMPGSGPRPIVPHVLSRPSIALSRMGVYPPEYKIQTVGEDGREIGNGVYDKPDVLAELVRFGVNSQPGDRRVLAGLQFPSDILYFLLRNEQGLVIQPFERAREGENPFMDGTKEKMYFPVVLRTDELPMLVEILSDPKMSE